MRGVLVVDPLESGGHKVKLVKRRGGAVQLVQVAHQPLHTGVLGRIEQMPVQALVMVPFAHLCKFAAHEQQLFAGVAEHEAEVGAQVGELLPAVARHLAQQRAFAVHHFVVRNRQDKILCEGVGQAEGHLILVMLAMRRVARHVLQRVVHPAHVPFVMKAQAACVGGARNAGKGGGFFRDGDGLRALAANHLVHAFQEIDGFEVFAAAQPVGKPFTGLAAVVAVQHGGHRIDAQAIDAKALQPVQAVADQKIAHLGAAQVVDQRIPVVVESFARIGVFIQMRAVKIAQAVRIGRKVRRHPVEQHAQAGRMAALHETQQTPGIAETGRGRVQADRLVAPGTVERMFADRQQFEVGKTHVPGIGHQLLGQLVPAEPALRAAGRVIDAPPRAQMHFINAHRRIQRIGAPAHFLRRRERGQGGHDAGRGRAQFGLPRIRVGAGRQQLAVGCPDFKLVVVADGHAGQKNLPNAAFAPQAHRVAPTVPDIEVAHHADARGIGRPDRKTGAGHAVHDALVGAQDFVGPQMRALAKQPDIHVAQHWPEAVRIF